MKTPEERAHGVWEAACDHPDGDIEGTLVAAIREAEVDARRAAFEDAARLHDSIDPGCQHDAGEGCGAMGAIIRYRDAIRQRARDTKP